jgi:hypothetical protein
MPTKTIDQFFSISQEEMTARCIKLALQLPTQLNWGFSSTGTSITSTISGYEKNIQYEEATNIDNSSATNCIAHAISAAYYAVSSSLDIPLNNFRCSSIKGRIRFRNDLALSNGRNAVAQYCETACHDQNWYWLFLELFGSPD